MKVRKFQVGGGMPAAEAPAEEAQMAEAPVEGGAPEEGAQAGGEQDPIVMLAQVAQQALESQDCRAAMAVCEGFLQLLSQMSQGGAPAEPTFQRNGGRLSRR